MTVHQIQREPKADIDDLLLKVSAQDRAAFARLYGLSSPKLYAVLIKIVKDKDHAADILQNVYLAIWRRAADFDPAKGKALSWMAIIARNAAIDHLRRRKPISASDDQIAYLPSAGRSALKLVNDQHCRSIVQRQLDKLPEQQKQAVTLFYLQEKSIAETADAMGAPVNTTKSWIRRGVERLQTGFSDLSFHDLVA